MQSAIRWVAVVLVATCAHSAYAISKADAQRNVNNAQNQVNNAQNNYNNNLANYQNAQANYNNIQQLDNQAYQNARNLPAQIAQDQVLVEQVRNNITTATSDLSTAKTNLTAAQATITDKKPTTQAAYESLQGAKQKALDVRTQLTSAFEATDEFRAAKAKADTANSKYLAASTAALDALSKTSSFKSAQASYDGNEQSVQRLRGAGDPEQLAAASRDWMKSKNDLESLKKDAVATDPPTVAAKGELDSANAAVKALRARFESDLAKNPDMGAAVAAQADAQASFDKSNAALLSATRSISTLQQKVADDQKAVEMGPGQLQTVQNDLNTRQRALDQARRDQQNYDGQLQNAQNNLNNLQQNLNNAANQLQQAQNQLRQAQNQMATAKN